jgi:hypothetical protein
MTPKSIFIAQPTVEFPVLIKACAEILNHNVSAHVDKTIKNISDSERFLSILSAMRDERAGVGLPPNLLTHVSFSVLTVATEADMLDILESCSGMAFTHTETKIRSVLAAVISGTMQQWRDAIVSGTGHALPSIRTGFNQIHDLFVQQGLAALWNSFEQKPQSDGTYKLIEYNH